MDLERDRIWPHVLTTFTEAMLSFAIGGSAVSVRIRAGAACRSWRRCWTLTFGSRTALPRVVLAPIFLLWFGLGIWSKVALGVTVVFFIVFFNTYQGVREVDPAMVNNARMLGASECSVGAARARPKRADMDFLEPARQHRHRDYRRGGRGISWRVEEESAISIAQAEGVFDTTGVFAGMAILAAGVLLVGRGRQPAGAPAAPLETGTRGISSREICVARAILQRLPTTDKIQQFEGGQPFDARGRPE